MPLCKKYRVVLGNCRVKFLRLNEDATQIEAVISDIPFTRNTIILPNYLDSTVLVQACTTNNRVFEFSQIEEFKDPVGTDLGFANFQAFSDALEAERDTCDCCT